MIHDRDILTMAGSFCQQKYGAFTYRTSTAQRGEGPALTTTRASVGYVHTRQGFVMPVAANTPRLHWLDLDGDGVMETPVLLIEPARTNELLQSADLSTTWANTRSTDNANAASAPDLTATADELVEDASASNTHYINQGLTGMTANARYALSVYARRNTRNWIKLRVLETAASANQCSQYFDLQNGVVGTGAAGGTGAYVRSGIERVLGTSDWYRCVLVGSVGNSATTLQVDLMLATGDGGDTYSGDGSSSVFLWGMQFEDGAEWASSYIPTTTAAATRNVDAISLPYYGPLVDVTLFAKFVELGAVFATSNSPRILQIGSTPAARIYNTNAANYRIEAAHSTTVSSVISSPTPTALQVVEFLGTVGPTGIVTGYQATDGGNITPGTPSGVATLQTKDDPTMYLGASGAGANAGGTGLIAAGVLRGTGHTIQDLRDLLAA